jgi:hypothetical protein
MRPLPKVIYARYKSEFSRSEKIYILYHVWMSLAKPLNGLNNSAFGAAFVLKYEILLMVNFGTPNMFITLWFELDYRNNTPLGTLMT